MVYKVRIGYSDTYIETSADTSKNMVYFQIEDTFEEDFISLDISIEDAKELIKALNLAINDLTKE